MLQLALKDTVLIPREGAEPIEGTALAELARQYILADSVIKRLSRLLDVEALSAMAEGVEISLVDEASARDSAARLGRVLADPVVPQNIRVEARHDEKIGRANVCNPVTNALLVCRLLL